VSPPGLLAPGGGSVDCDPFGQSRATAPCSRSCAATLTTSVISYAGQVGLPAQRCPTRSPCRRSSRRSGSSGSPRCRTDSGGVPWCWPAQWRRRGGPSWCPHDQQVHAPVHPRRGGRSGRRAGSISKALAALHSELFLHPPPPHRSLARLPDLRTRRGHRARRLRLGPRCGRRHDHGSIIIVPFCLLSVGCIPAPGDLHRRPHRGPRGRGRRAGRPLTPCWTRADGNEDDTAEAVVRAQREQTTASRRTSSRPPTDIGFVRDRAASGKPIWHEPTSDRSSSPTNQFEGRNPSPSAGTLAHTSVASAAFRGVRRSLDSTRVRS
jgi:hypothetical protein